MKMAVRQTFLLRIAIGCIRMMEEVRFGCVIITTVQFSKIRQISSWFNSAAGLDSAGLDFSSAFSNSLAGDFYYYQVA